MDHDSKHEIASTHNPPATSVKNQRLLAAQISQALQQLHEPPSLVVKKGQVEMAARTMNLFYAAASSSLTVTYVDRYGNKMGGYGMLSRDASAQQQSIDPVILKLNARIGDRPGKLLLTGNEAIWNQELPCNSILFSDVSTIIAYLQRNNLSTTIHLLNVTHYIPPSSDAAPFAVNVGTNTYSIVTDDNQILLQNHW